MGGSPACSPVSHGRPTTAPETWRGSQTDRSGAARGCMSAAGDLAPYRRVRARKLRQRRWRCVTGAADRRRRDRRPCPCQLRAGGLCVGRGKAPLLICSGAASRRGLPYGGSTRFYWGSTRWQGHRGRFTGLRLRCGDWRAALGGCHCASLMMKRRAAAGAVRPCVRHDPGSLPSSFPQVTCLDRSGRPVLLTLFACEMRARPALAVLVWSGDGSPVWGCITTLGDQVPPRTPKPGKFPANQTPLEHAARPPAGRRAVPAPPRGEGAMTCGCRKPMPPGDTHESRLRHGRAAGPGTDPGQ